MYDDAHSTIVVYSLDHKQCLRPQNLMGPYPGRYPQRLNLDFGDSRGEGTITYHTYVSAVPISCKYLISGGPKTHGVKMTYMFNFTCLQIVPERHGIKVVFVELEISSCHIKTCLLARQEDVSCL